jgi:hypothetical protein
MKNAILSCLLLLLNGVFPLWSSPPMEQQEDETYSAVAIGVGGAVGGASMWIDMYIEKFTSDAETMELLAVLKDEGQDALLRKLERLEKGRINPQRGDGVSIAVARRIESETATIIRLIAARQMPFIELYRGGRSTDYPIGLIELIVDKDGNGQGAVVAAAKVKMSDENKLELESLGNQYVRLTNVRRMD